MSMRRFASVWEARVHSHVCGDGHMYIETGKRGLRYVIEYTNNDYSLIRDFVNSVYRSYGVRPFTVHHKRGHYIARVRRKDIYLRLKELGAGASKEWRVNLELFKDRKGELRIEAMQAWLSAFIDDEGYIDLEKKRLIINSVNLQGLEDIQAILSLLEVESKIYEITKGRTFRLTVSGRENILRIIRYIKLVNPKKKEKLEKLNIWANIEMNSYPKKRI